MVTVNSFVSEFADAAHHDDLHGHRVVAHGHEGLLLLGCLVVAAVMSTTVVAVAAVIVRGNCLIVFVPLLLLGGVRGNEFGFFLVLCD